MDRIKRFVRTTTIGGIIVISPVVLLFTIFKWLFGWLTDLIQPFTDLLIELGRFKEFIADIIIIFIILGLCFVVGLAVRTKVGRFLQEGLEKHILSVAPGYRMIKETVIQVLGRERPPFSSVVMVRPYECETLMTAFITDEHPGGWLTVFIPTGPNPTTGYIVHLPPDRVHRLNARTNEAIRSVISCGAGSARIMSEYFSQQIEKKGEV